MMQNEDESHNKLKQLQADMEAIQAYIMRKTNKKFHLRLIFGMIFIIALSLLILYFIPIRP